jgi:hypothetical protein
MEDAMTDTLTGYVESVAGRLQADGCQVMQENWSVGPALVGHRSDVKAGTRVLLLTVVAAVPHISQPLIESFTNTALDYGQARKGQMMGMHAVATLPCMVGERIDQAAVEWAQQKQRKRFAAIARPVIVDPATGAVVACRKTGVIGSAYASHMRNKIDLYFPPPGM